MSQLWSKQAAASYFSKQDAELGCQPEVSRNLHLTHQESGHRVGRASHDAEEVGRVERDDAIGLAVRPLSNTASRVLEIDGPRSTVIAGYIELKNTSHGLDKLGPSRESLPHISEHLIERHPKPQLVCPYSPRLSVYPRIADSVEAPGIYQNTVETKLLTTFGHETNLSGFTAPADAPVGQGPW